MADRQSPTPGEITIMAAGAVMLIFSFLHFAGGHGAPGAVGLFPIATLLPLYGLVMAAADRADQVRRRSSCPSPYSASPGSRSTSRSALMAGLMALGWLLTDYGRQGIGLWFEILGGIALVVGAVLLQRERNTGAIG